MAILINDTAPRNQYTATSGQTVFTVSFEFFENADLKVYKNAVLQTITTHYTVTGAGVTGGGSITLTSGATAGDIITIVRDIPVKRVTDFPTSGPFNISALNTELDKIVAMVQEREDDITRVVQLADTDTSTSLTLPVAASRASKVLGFDATGNAIVMQEIGNYRGNWAAATAYILRDIVKDTSNANIYICVQAHTSSGSQPLSTNANAASWALLIDGASAAAAASSASAAASSASAAASSASAASGSASAASTSASNASTSATNASNSASSASTSATNAANSASSASTSATNAANSATSASGSATTATTQASNASSSASAAAASASTATTQASNASTSASNAASSASAAATSASNAASSASSASTSATSAAAAQSAAESARDATLAAYDNFDDRYLGAKTSNPSLDNDGNALVAGALYFNSVAGEMRLWTGSAWVAAYVSGSGFLSTSGGTITGDLVVSASGSTDALRITQTGTGNALVVEDAANPDSSPFAVNTIGQVLIGRTTAPFGSTSLAIEQAVADTAPANIDFSKNRAGATVISGDGLGRIRFWGYDGASLIDAAEIVAAVDGTPGLNDMPGRLVFNTTADGASTPTERMRIASAGQIGIGGANYGTAGQVLTSGGAAAAPSWATVTATGRLINTQVFTSSGTYTRTAGVTTAVVIAVGGGGGGKGSNGTSTGGNGGNGGTTSFGSHVTAAGGSGSTGRAGGAGGTGGTGATLAIKGQGGGASVPFGVNSGGGNGGGQGGGAGVNANNGASAGNAGVRGGGGSGAATYVGGCCAGTYAGGGGGQGETCIDYTTTVGATETVTIGAGGTAGTGSSAGGAGGAGYIIVYEYS